MASVLLDRLAVGFVAAQNQPAKSDLNFQQSPAKPTPDWVKIVDHGQYDPRLKGWSDEMLAAVYPALRVIQFQVQLVPNGSFLHFGSTRQLVESGLALVEQTEATLAINNSTAGGATITADAINRITLAALSDRFAWIVPTAAQIA